MLNTLWRALVFVSIVAASVRESEFFVGSVNAGIALQVGPLLAAVVVNWLAAPHRRVPVRGPAVLVILLLTWATLSTTWATLPVSITATSSLAFVCLFAYYTAGTRWRDPATCVDDFFAAIWAVTFYQGVGLVLWLAGDDRVTQFGLRYKGLSSNPNYSGFMSAICLLMLISFLAHGFRRHGTIATTVAGLVLLATLLLSGSRGSLLLAVVGIVALLLVHPRRRTAILPAAYAAAIVTVIVVATGSSSRLFGSSVFERSGNSRPGAGRLDIALSRLQTVDQNLFIGTGFSTDQGITGEELNSHNLLLLTMVELGLVGLLILLTLFVTSIVLLMRARYGRLFVPLMIGVLAYETTEASLFGVGNPNALVAWLIISTAGASFVSHQKASASPSDAIRVGAR